MSRIKKDTIHKGEIYVYSWDFSETASKLATTVSSADWSTQDTGIISIANESLSTSVTSAQLTALTTGVAIIKTQAVYADGQVSNRYIELTVNDPEN